MGSCGDMEPSASSQMLRGGRVRPAEGMAPRITRIYTYEGGGGLLERWVVWLGAGHRRDLKGTKI